MSFQYLEFSCSKCSLTDSDISYFGPMVYQAPDGPIPVERQLGWCKHCKGIVPIEILPSPQRIEKIRSRTYPKLWGEPAPDTVVTAEEAARESEYQQHCRSRDIADEKLRLAYMKLRISSPRCLRCGSTEVSGLSPDESFRETLFGYDSPTPIGVRHPKCGGELLARCSDIYVSILFNDRVYDSEGNRILPDNPESPTKLPKQGRLWE